MDDTKENVVFCVLNLQEASDCIKNIYPDLSTTLLKLAMKLITDLNISQDDLQQRKNLVNAIVDAIKCS